METSRDKLDRLRQDQLPQLLDQARAESPMAAMVISTLAPTVEPMLKRELEKRSADELDRLLTGAVELFASLRSDDAPDLLVDSTGAYAVGHASKAVAEALNRDNLPRLARDDGEPPLSASTADLIRALGNEGVKIHYRIKAADPGGDATSQHRPGAQP